MATTGFVLPTANNNDNGIENNWNNPGNAQTDDTNSTNPNGQDAVWFWSGFDFAGSGDGLSSGDTVTGINVRIRGYDSFGDGGWSLQIAHKSDASTVWSTYTAQRMPATGSFQTSQTPLTRTLALTDVPTATEALSSNFRLGVQVSPGSADPTEATLELIEVEIVFTAAGGGGAITGSASIGVSPSASATGRGALSGTTSTNVSATASLGATGQLSASETIGLTTAASLSGNSGVSASASLQFSNTATLRATGTLSGGTAVSLAESAQLSAIGSLSAATALNISTAAALSGVGSGAIQASTSINLTPAGGLTATGSLAASTGITFGSSADLLGNASILGNTSITFSESADLTTLAAGSISGTASLSLSSNATIAGLGALTGSANVAISATATPVIIVVEPTTIPTARGSLGFTNRNRSISASNRQRL